MKKIALLVFAGAVLASAACSKFEDVSEMKDFTGTNVKVGDNKGAPKNLKLLVLNEGAFPGASTLDVLDLSRQTYYADIFGQANPGVKQGLGNTGNDVIVAGDRIWLAMNASNNVVGINAKTFKLEVEIEILSPRSFAADDTYLYVTSYESAVYGSEYPVIGTIYRIKLKDLRDFQTLRLGYQPEGVAIENGKIYVANSGGYNYVHDNRVTVIDQSSFTYIKDYELPVTNLNMVRNSAGKIWVSTYGESTWTQDAGGEWVQAVSAPMSLVSLSQDGSIKVVDGVHADKITECDGIVYALGNNAEMTGGWDYCLYKVNAETQKVETVHFAGTDLANVSYPYCILINQYTSDILIADASFSGDSTLWCFTSDYKLKWSVQTGVGTGHLYLYQR